MSRQPKFKPVTPRIVDRLRDISGAPNVLYGDAEALKPYSHDETADCRLPHMPEAVVKPGSAGEVAELLKLADAERVPVTPRGGGTGLAGGAVPLYGGVVVSLERMNRLLDLDLANLVAVLEPGMVTRKINELAQPAGVFYAGYPMSLDECFIGGNVATNAGGAKAIKYGVTGRYVAGLGVVTAGGQTLDLGGRLVKNASDSSLLALMIGSEGTLGLLTRIILRLLPVPRVSIDLLATFATLAGAAHTVPKLVAQTGIIPAACEFMDREAFCLGSEYVGEPPPPERLTAALLLNLDGSDEAQVRREAETVAALCRREGALEVEVAADPQRADRLWAIRRSIGSACNRLAPFQGDEDIVVPVAAIPELVQVYHQLGAKYGLRMPAYGHAGDGNIHAHYFPQAGWTIEQWEAVLARLMPEMYGAVAQLGGKISGEHGIGLKRKKYLPLVVSPHYIEALRSVKRALDPHGILNPGKVID